MRLLFPMLDDRTREIFDEDGGCDFAHTVDVRRGRVAISRQHAPADGQHGPGGPSRE